MINIVKHLEFDGEQFKLSRSFSSYVKSAAQLSIKNQDVDNFEIRWIVSLIVFVRFTTSKDTSTKIVSRNNKHCNGINISTFSYCSKFLVMKITTKQLYYNNLNSR